MPTIRKKSFQELFGLPPAPKNGRARLIAAAVDLFYSHGMNAVGIDQVIAKAGVTKTTFYKHFDSKDQLMVAAVEHRDAWESQAWDRAVRKLVGDDPAQQLLAAVDVIDAWFNDPDFHGCMFLNTATEFPNPHDPVHKAAAAHRKRAREYRRDLALAAGAEPKAAESFVDCYTMLLEGALVMRQTDGRNDAARVVRPAIEQLIRAHLPSVDDVAATKRRASK
jgi:AcrR family transcriptional regulator